MSLEVQTEIKTVDLLKKTPKGLEWIETGNEFWPFALRTLDGKAQGFIESNSWYSPAKLLFWGEGIKTAQRILDLLK